MSNEFGDARNKLNQLIIITLMFAMPLDSVSLDLYLSIYLHLFLSLPITTYLYLGSINYFFWIEIQLIDLSVSLIKFWLFCAYRVWSIWFAIFGCIKMFSVSKTVHNLFFYCLFVRLFIFKCTYIINADYKTHINNLLCVCARSCICVPALILR